MACLAYWYWRLRLEHLRFAALGTGFRALESDPLGADSANLLFLNCQNRAQHRRNLPQLLNGGRLENYTGGSFCHRRFRRSRDPNPKLLLRVSRIYHRHLDR